MSFNLGQVVATPGVLSVLDQAGVTAHDLIQRHLACDWSQCSKHDAAANKAALRDGSRIFSVYKFTGGLVIWVITEAVGDDGRRASTCVLRPQDY